MLSIIFPTWNEEENVKILFEEISASLKGIEYEIIVVDANSADNTVKVAEDMKNDGYPVSIHLSPIKKDLAGDTYYGFQFAKFDLIAVMDTDYQHNPIYYPKMYEIITTDPKVDMVIGSRYAEGGDLGDWVWYRKVISRISVKFIKLISGVSDPLTQFYIIRKKVLDVPDIRAEGMRLSLQLIVKGNINEIVEIPITFRSRGGGETTQSFSRVVTDLKTIGEIVVLRIKKILGA